MFTRPGQLTSALRQAWGVESLKKTDGKRKSDDRHHALDALVVAAVGEAEVQRLTRSFQQWEQQGLGRPLRYVEEPWPSFRAELEAAFHDKDRLFVARPERRRARGEGHAATIRQVAERNGGPVVYERKAIAALKESDLDRIKDPDRNGLMIESIRAWIKAGRPADQLPTSPKGDVISKVRLATKGKPSVAVRGGTADRGEIVRVDVFARPNKKGKDEFYLVPVYPHQVMNRKAWPEPPMRAVAAFKDEEDRFGIDQTYSVKFSLYPRSCIEAVKPDGEVLYGYFQGVHRGTGNISLFRHHSPEDGWEGIGPRRLLSLRKYSVDRFGRQAEIKTEVRTWHGVACTSPIPAG